MRPLVAKFGGTSVADAGAIERVAGIVSSGARTDAFVVVTSAMAKVTDTLLEACALARRGEASTAGRLVDLLEERHVRTVSELGLGGPDDDVRGQLQAEFRALRSVLDSIAVLRESTPRAQDRVAAAGELLSSRILAAALVRHGVPAEWVDARFVLLTDDQHGAAAPDMPRTIEAVREVLRPLLECGRVPVLGGFIGSTSAGVTTTLGRGGSDYSAAVLGAALQAREIHIWTDVDGMLTADPRVLPDAQLVPRLSFGEASELAYFGAKVLHPSTIVPAVERDIPVRILNTMKPSASGTLITSGAPASGPLTAIACKRNITVVDVTSTRMLMAHGFLRRLFEVFERHRTSVDVVTTSEISVSMTLDDDSRVSAIAEDLREFASVQVEPHMAIVSAVGDQLRGDPTLGIKVVAALDGLPLRMVSQAASRRNVTVVVRDQDVPHAMSRLHEAFFQMAEVS
jgi:aspartate kinase